MGCNCGGNHLTESECPSTATNPCGERIDGAGTGSESDRGAGVGRKTYCDRDCKDNVWVERDGNIPDAPGICLLDTMNEDQVINSISRDERARKDLLRVTSDPRLLYLAGVVPPLGTDESEDGTMKQFNANNKPESIPFYAIFRGQPPFAQ